VRGCQEAGCALIGGETAEMPGFYPDGEYDLAGFCVGVVDADKLIDGSEIRVGDRIIGSPLRDCTATVFPWHGAFCSRRGSSIRKTNRRPG